MARIVAPYVMPVFLILKSKRTSALHACSGPGHRLRPQAWFSISRKVYNELRRRIAIMRDARPTEAEAMPSAFGVMPIQEEFFYENQIA